MSASQPGVASRSSFEGGEAVRLSNAHAAVVVLPRAGARIASLRSLASGREWLWRAADRRPAMACPTGTPFEDSPLLGIDECLPTIGACTHGNAVPGHALEDGDPISGNVIAMPVTWRGHSDLSALRGREVVLHVELQRAKFYSYSFWP